MFKSIKAFDVFTKSAPDIQSKQSVAGGLISLLSIVFLLTLIVSETHHFLYGELVREVKVETYQSDRKLRLDLNLSFFSVPCGALSMDYEDSMGSHYAAHSLNVLHLDVDGRIINSQEAQTLRLNEDFAVNRTYCGDCYGAEVTLGQCCNTCDEVYDAYARKSWALPSRKEQIAQCRRKLSTTRTEGCQVYGHLMLKEVPGAVHFTMPQQFHDLTHTIHHLQMLDYDRPDAQVRSSAASPLDGTFSSGHSSFFYVLKLTSARTPDGVRFFETSAHFRGHSENKSPAVYITYDIEPITTQYRYPMTLARLLVSLCGIVGGSFAVSELIARLIG